MTEYISSFIIELVVRQARRISRLSTGEEATGTTLPTTVPESLRTWPTRWWNTSPPPSISEDDHQRGALPVGSSFGQWASKIPSPPLDPMETGAVEAVEASTNQETDTNVTAFPTLDSRAADVQAPRPARLDALRAESETSINPQRELPSQSRIYGGAPRGHAHSDPITELRRRARRLSISSPLGAEAGILPSEADTFNASRKGSGALPEDDGMGPLRQRINVIWQGDGTAAGKSQLIHALMNERYKAAQQNTRVQANSPLGPVVPSKRSLTPSSTESTHKRRPGSPLSIHCGIDRDTTFNLTDADLEPTFVPFDLEDPFAEQVDEEDEPRVPELGCKHYKRNVKMQCNKCQRWHTCRFCHDEVEDHKLPRQETKHMLCMFCTTAQLASQSCRGCGHPSAWYYCPICKLWNNDPEKSIYHCNDCGICRLGQGLGKDFLHCKKCCVCVSVDVEHNCIEQSTKSDCPICGEYMFTSAASVVFMKCGHSIHERCFKQWCTKSYKCPICSKSVVNMASQFTLLDRQIAAQPMPEEYRNVRAYVFCNDCGVKASTKYHWLGLKCEHCESYNTTQLRLLVNEPLPDQIASQLDTAVTAHPPLPQNVADEAVSIPNSRPASRRPSTAISDVQRASTSPWLAPQARGARSVSPIVRNYFGVATREQAATPDPVMVPEDDLDFWGRQSPTYQDQAPQDPDDDQYDNLSSSSDNTEIENGDDEDDEDQMEIFGHR